MSKFIPKSKVETERMRQRERELTIDREIAKRDNDPERIAWREFMEKTGRFMSFSAWQILNKLRSGK